MQFNVNEFVRVKLTDYGRECLRKDHEALFANIANPPPYSPRKEDAEGWSSWKMWQLMMSLGPHIRMGVHPPFEPEIEILEKAEA